MSEHIMAHYKTGKEQLLNHHSTNIITKQYTITHSGFLELGQENDDEVLSAPAKAGDKLTIVWEVAPLTLLPVSLTLSNPTTQYTGIWLNANNKLYKWLATHTDLIQQTFLQEAEQAGQPTVN